MRRGEERRGGKYEYEIVIFIINSHWVLAFGLKQTILTTTTGRQNNFTIYLLTSLILHPHSAFSSFPFFFFSFFLFFFFSLSNNKYSYYYSNPTPFHFTLVGGFVNLHPDSGRSRRMRRDKKMKGRISMIGSYAIASSIKDHHHQRPSITCTTFNILAPIYNRLNQQVRSSLLFSFSISISFLI